MNAFRVWWKRQGLRLRLQILVQGFLVVVLGAVQVWAMARFEEQVLSGAEARAHEVADGIVNGLNTLMVTRIGGTDVISDKKARMTFIHKMGDGDRIKEVRVARAKSMDDEFPEPLPEEKPVDAIDQRVLETGKSEFHLLEAADGRQALRVVVPFLNEKNFRGTNCLDCHGEAEGATLGVASVVVDVQNEMTTIARANAAFWVVQFLLQAACAVMLYFVARRIVRQLGGEPEVAANLAQQVAQGDLTVKLRVHPHDRTSMMARLKDMQAGLVRVVSDVRRSAEGLAAASTQIAHGNQDLSTRTEEQASALDVTASSMEQLGVTVARNADHARQANELALSASSVAVKGGQVVGQVVDTMRDINASSKKIADIISVIDSIAFQTNILALNAAVEAARAGEQGRGFAVVASEVRMLAQRSADASKEIKNLISGSVDRVEQGSALVDQAGATMQEIVASIKRVTDIMGEISTASAEQSAGVAQIGQAITKMDRHTQQNAALVEQSAAAAQSLNEQAQQLLQAVAVFKMERADAERV